MELAVTIYANTEVQLPLKFKSQITNRELMSKRKNRDIYINEFSPGS